MNKRLVIAAAAMIAVASLSPSGAQARDRSGAIAAGVIGGLAFGALAGAAIANSHRSPVYVYDDDYVPVYRSPVRTYHYYGGPYYSGYYGYSYGSGYGYSSGYQDGYSDAVSGWSDW